MNDDVNTERKISSERIKIGTGGWPRMYQLNITAESLFCNFHSLISVQLNDGVVFLRRWQIFADFGSFPFD